MIGSRIVVNKNNKIDRKKMGEVIQINEIIIKRILLKKIIKGKKRK